MASWRSHRLAVTWYARLDQQQRTGWWLCCSL